MERRFHSQNNKSSDDARSGRIEGWPTLCHQRPDHSCPALRAFRPMGTTRTGGPTFRFLKRGILQIGRRHRESYDPAHDIFRAERTLLQWPESTTRTRSAGTTNVM